MEMVVFPESSLLLAGEVGGSEAACDCVAC